MPILPRLNQFRNLSTPPFTTKQSEVLLLTQTAHRISSGKCLYHFKNAMLSGVWPFVTPWTVARQASLSMGFSRQESWSGLPCPPPGDLPNRDQNQVCHIAGEFFTVWATSDTQEWAGVGSLSLLQRNSQPRNQTRVSCIAGRFFPSWATREALEPHKFPPRSL